MIMRLRLGAEARRRTRADVRQSDPVNGDVVREGAAAASSSELAVRMPVVHWMSRGACR
jgi:hypothetical protein